MWAKHKGPSRMKTQILHACRCELQTHLSGTGSGSVEIQLPWHLSDKPCMSPSRKQLPKTSFSGLAPESSSPHWEYYREIKDEPLVKLCAPLTPFLVLHTTSSRPGNCVFSYLVFSEALWRRSDCCSISLHTIRGSDPISPQKRGCP